MRNIKLTIEYDGSRYQGWTRLGKDESGNTISNKITEVLKKMTEEDDLELFCGCRTEVGVHAYAQIANFKTSSSTTTQNIKHYLNRYLPMDIAIIDVKEVPERFLCTGEVAEIMTSCEFLGGLLHQTFVWDTVAMVSVFAVKDARYIVDRHTVYIGLGCGVQLCVKTFWNLFYIDDCDIHRKVTVQVMFDVLCRCGRR